MASGWDTFELLFSCQVCFEEFEEDGAHVPRLLPCTHTLCHNCIGRLIQENRIECPECREKHEAKNEEKSFPQNKYILTQIKRKSSQGQPKIVFTEKGEEPSNLDLLPMCQVCYEDFEQHGAHVPRLLPCTHTLCHACIGRLIQQNKILCPECRQKHEAKYEEKSFPQNKFLLIQILRSQMAKEELAYQDARKYGTSKNKRVKLNLIAHNTVRLIGNAPC